MDDVIPKKKRLCGWIGTICLLMIIPIKLLRVFTPYGGAPALGFAPSVLGPPGLLFLLVSSSGRPSRLTLEQKTLLVGALAAALEFMQLLPRPGILARASYVFDFIDLAVSLCSVVTAYGIIKLAFRWRLEDNSAQT